MSVYITREMIRDAASAARGESVATLTRRLARMVVRQVQRRRAMAQLRAMDDEVCSIQIQPRAIKIFWKIGEAL